MKAEKAEDDQELVGRCQKGDISAFEALVHKYKQKAYSIAYRFTRNEEDALDLSQEAFVKAYQSIGSFKKTATFYTWLYRIVVNICIDFQRKIKKEDSLRKNITDWQEEIEMVDDNPSLLPDTALINMELKENIEKAIALLSPQHREILILRDFEDMSYKEITAILKISEGTVMSRLFHARRNLKDVLKSYILEEV